MCSSMRTRNHDFHFILGLETEKFRVIVGVWKGQVQVQVRFRMRVRVKVKVWVRD